MITRTVLLAYADARYKDRYQAVKVWGRPARIPHQSVITLQAKKARFLRMVKRVKGCVKCGFHDHRALVFHHRDPATKSFNISTYHSYGFAKIITELGKCDVMCANCHSILHASS